VATILSKGKVVIDHSLVGGSTTPLIFYFCIFII
jgi:hypothetical protein